MVNTTLTTVLGARVEVERLGTRPQFAELVPELSRRQTASCCHIGLPFPRLRAALPSTYRYFPFVCFFIRSPSLDRSYPIDHRHWYSYSPRRQSPKCSRRQAARPRARWRLCLARHSSFHHLTLPIFANLFEAVKSLRIRRSLRPCCLLVSVEGTDTSFVWFLILVSLPYQCALCHPWHRPTIAYLCLIIVSTFSRYFTARTLPHLIISLYFNPTALAE